jgi:glyoxylase I family protein
MFKKIDHIEIVPEDLGKTLNFYTDVLGFKLKERQAGRPGSPWKEIIYLTLNGSLLEILDPVSAAPRSTAAVQVGYRMIALEVDDMDKAVEYLKGKGVELSRPAMLLGKSKRAEITDPNGLSIEIRQW